MLWFLSSQPTWIAALIIVVAPTLLAISGPYFVRQRLGLHRLEKNNEIAGFKFATVGVIYAVILAFAIIAAWEKFSEAEVTVAQEAGAAATLYRLNAGPEPEVVAAKAALNAYLESVIGKEWPAMEQGHGSGDVTRALDALYRAELTSLETAKRNPAVGVEALKQLDVLIQTRRVRLHLAEGVVPGMLWAVLVLGAVLTIAFTLFFGTTNLKAQMAMTGILSLIVCMGLLVIVGFESPFAGSVHVEAHPIAGVLEELGRR
jgi:hypothetical protein